MSQAKLRKSLLEIISKVKGSTDTFVTNGISQVALGFLARMPYTYFPSLKRHYIGGESKNAWPFL